MFFGARNPMREFLSLKNYQYVSSAFFLLGLTVFVCASLPFVLDF